MSHPPHDAGSYSRYFRQRVGRAEKDVPIVQDTNRLTASAIAIFITSCRCAVSPHNQSTAASSGTTVIKSLAIKIANEIIHGAESGVALIRENRERFKFSSITSRRKVIKGSQYRQVVENKVQVKLGKAASSYFPQAACLRWVIVTGIG